MLIGELIWATDIGRFDILNDVLVLSEFQASPRERHLHQVIEFMQNNPKLKIYFDTRFPNMDSTSFSGISAEESRKKHLDAMKELQKDMPKPRGKSVTITAFVYASHASDKRTRR